MRKFYWYPKCSTCQKAKKWLDAHDAAYEAIHIVESPPSKEELREAAEKSGLPLQKLFNTSGRVYRDQNYKEKIKTADEDQLLAWLAADGMLIKRPILLGDEDAAVGFKEEVYEQIISN